MTRFRSAASLAVAVFGLAVAVARAEPPRLAPPCFSLSRWHGWESPGPRVVLLHVDMHDVYRLDLAADAPMLQSAGVHLTSTVSGPDRVCAPVDLQLQVSDGEGFSEPLFVRALTKLTPDEVLALRKPRRPR